MRHEIDDIYPEKPTPICLDEKGSTPMFKTIAWSVLITMMLAAGLHFYALSRMHYTLSDYENIATIQGEAEIMYNEKKFCTPDNKQEQDLTTCGLWQKKHRRLIKLGPNGLAAMEKSEDEVLANAGDSSANPTLGDGSKKGK